MGTTLEAAVSAVAEALGIQGDIIGDSGADPRLELFHAANSICLQKMRTVLAQHVIGHRSHTMNIFAGQTYFPSHVRLRTLDSLATSWLFGSKPSMADLLWSVGLLRIKNMGAAALWEGRGLHSIE